MAKIAVVVSNPCAPDHRVTKQAEFLASQGHHVRIFCTSKAGIPTWEVVHGVEYYRVDFNLSKSLKLFFSFKKRRNDRERRQRVAQIKAQQKSSDVL